MKDSSLREKEYYKEKIIEMVGKIENPIFLKRIYQLSEYLYIHKKEKE